MYCTEKKKKYIYIFINISDISIQNMGNHDSETPTLFGIPRDILGLEKIGDCGLERAQRCSGSGYGCVFHISKHSLVMLAQQ